MRATRTLGAFLFTLALTGPAAGDELHALRSEKVVERGHDITMTLSPGSAKMVVRRTVFNGGDRHDEATFDIDVPEGAVATGLRTLGVLKGVPKWFAGELMEAEAAAEKYRELTGIGGFYPKDPALLSWRSMAELKLQVFPCAPDAEKTVEYTLTLPTEYRDGMHHYALPEMGTAKMAAKVTVRAAPGAGTVFIDGKRQRTSKPFSLDKLVQVALSTRQHKPFEGRVASVKIDKDTHLVSYQLEANRKLSKVPRRAQVVIVLDHSLSLESAYAKAQLATARAYLSHLPDARVQVISFNRQVKRHHTRFVSAKQALKDLSQLKIERRNGSQVDEALIMAEKVLATGSQSRPKRILLLTDSRVRSLLDAAQVRASIGTQDAILHVARADWDPSHQLEVEDAHPWNAAIRSTGGLAWSLGSGTVDDAALRLAVLSLVRPTKLRNVAIGAPSSPLMNGGFDDVVLAEGAGASAVWVQDKALPHIKIEGELWATPVRHVLRPDAKTGDTWSALAFGSDVWSELDEKQQMVLAKRGKAVSPVTSYLAIEPGVRPSTEGLDHNAGIGLGGVGTIGHGSGSGMRTGRGIFDFDAHLRAALRNAWVGCGGKGTMSVTVETTKAEIVDVRDATVSDASKETCVVEAMWKHRLPVEFDLEHKMFRIEVDTK